MFFKPPAERRIRRTTLQYAFPVLRLDANAEVGVQNCKFHAYAWPS